MEAIKYPVRYNRQDNILEDASGMTIALLAWPNCMLPIELVDGRGEELQRVINSGKANWMINTALLNKDSTNISGDVNITKDVTIVEKTGSFVSSMVDAIKGLGKGKKVGKVRIYRNGEGKELKLVGRGRAPKGYVKVS